MLGLHLKKKNPCEIISQERLDIEKHEKSKTLKIAVILSAVLILVVIVCVLAGRYSCTKLEILQCFFYGIVDLFCTILEIPAMLIPGLDYTIANPVPITWPPNVDIVLWSVRIPRIIAVIFVGGGLAISGANYQGLFKNPLVSESILGVSAGASLGASLSILCAWGYIATNIAAFIGGILAVSLTYVISQIFTGNKTLLLVLSGSIVSSIFSAGLSIVKYVAPTETALPEITFWLMGSFGDITVSNVYFLVPVIAVCTLLLMSIRWRVNVLSFGDDEALALGINVKRTRIMIIICSTLITASAVCVCGMIGWVGVVIPQITRMIIGPDARKLIPCSFAIGAAFLLIVDLVCRTLTVAEIPVGIVTSIVGAPLYIIVLKRAREGWA